MLRSLLIPVILALPIFAAEQHPNYAGVWTLVPDESDFAGKTAPRSKTETIQQSDSSLTEDVHENDAEGTSRNGVLRYTIGKHSTYDAFGQQWISTSEWDGQDLVIHTESTGKGEKTNFGDRWTLSLDGSILTVRRHYEGQGIRYDQMMIYHKQEPVAQ